MFYLYIFYILTTIEVNVKQNKIFLQKRKKNEIVLLILILLQLFTEIVNQYFSNELSTDEWVSFDKDELLERIKRESLDNGAVAHGSNGLPVSNTGDTLK